MFYDIQMYTKARHRSLSLTHEYSLNLTTVLLNIRFNIILFIRWSNQCLIQVMLLRFVFRDQLTGHLYHIVCLNEKEIGPWSILFTFINRIHSVSYDSFMVHSVHTDPALVNTVLNLCRCTTIRLIGVIVKY